MKPERTIFSVIDASPAVKFWIPSSQNTGTADPPPRFEEEEGM